MDRRPAVSAPGTVGRRTPPAYAAGPDWQEKGFRQVGWALLPLRGFLAITFVVAGLQKLANPDYFDSHNPISFAATMRALRHTSPIGPLLGLSQHAPGLVGLLIALGELAVGVGMAVGLWARLAATAGALLSLTFFLTVSWNTSPYYYGSDIVFLFAWTPFIAIGAAGVLSTDAYVEQRARPGRERPADMERRRLLLGARAFGVVALGTGAVAALTAVLGRVVGGTNGTTGPAAAAPRGGRGPSGVGATSPPGTRQRRRRRSAAVGTAIGAASSVPAGHAQLFHNPHNGGPGFVVHEPTGHFVAFSAVCTHAGCTVGFDTSSQQFICPCHGGAYSARTGQVLAGPPPAPLQPIKVIVSNGEIRVV